MHKQLQPIYLLDYSCKRHHVFTGSPGENKATGGSADMFNGDFFLFCRHCYKLVKLQMCVTVNFLVCVLCLQALVVPPSVKLSELFLTSGARWRGGSHAGTITPIDRGKGEDIKGVCHICTPVLLCLGFILNSQLSTCRTFLRVPRCICWRVSGSLVRLRISNHTNHLQDAGTHSAACWRAAERTVKAGALWSVCRAS